MPSVTIVVAGQAPHLGAHPHATITWGRGLFKATIPIVTSFEFSEVPGVNWVELERPGRLPLTVYGGDKLSRATLEATILDPDDRTIERQLTALRSLANTHAGPVLITFGSSHLYTTTGHWLVEDMSITPTRWRHGDNEVLEAEVVIELKMAMLPELATF